MIKVYGVVLLTIIIFTGCTNQSEIEDFNTELSLIESEYEMLEAEIEKLEIALTETNLKLANANDILKDRNEVISDLQIQINTLSEEKKECETQFTSLQEEFEAEEERNSQYNIIITLDNEQDYVNNDLPPKPYFKDIIQESIHIYLKFMVLSPDYDYESQIMIDGTEYYRITEDNYNSIKNIRSYISRYYTDEIVDRLVEHRSFVELDEVIYTTRGEDGIITSPTRWDLSFVSYDKESRTVGFELLFYNSEYLGIHYDLMTVSLKNIDGVWKVSDMNYTF